MKGNYDFSTGIKNPYSKKLSKQNVVLSLDTVTVNYFRDMAMKSEISYQDLIALYLTDCVVQKRKITIDAKRSGKSR